MKKALVMVLVGLTMLVGTALPAKADRVRCGVPTQHRVVCYNFTPYRVHVSLRMNTSDGTRYRRFTIFNQRFVVNSTPIVNSVSWRWWF